MTPNIKNSTHYDKTNSEGILQWKNVFTVLVGKHKGRRLLWRRTHRWRDNMNIILNRTVGHGLGSLGSGQNWQALLNMVISLWVMLHLR